MGNKSAIDNLTITRVASRQHGVIGSWQLRAAGLTRSGISRRADTGRLHRLHRGVYAVGHRPRSAESCWMAAVLACGRGVAGRRTEEVGKEGRPGSGEWAGGGYDTVLDHWGAALSHRGAAALWGLLPWRGGLVDVSVTGAGGRRKRQGIRLHRCPSLVPRAVTLHRGIPVTTAARTLSDLRRAAGRAGGISPKELRRAARQADVLGLPIDSQGDRDRTRSDLEQLFLRLCRRHHLPAPEVNVRVGRHLVDFLWRDCRLVVETDGYRYHRGRQAFYDDRGRDLELRQLGYEVLHLSEWQVEKEPERVVEVLGMELGARGAPRADL